MMTPCRYCVAPKRAPGCKGSCPEYADWLPGEMVRKETIRQNREKEKFNYSKNIRKYR